MSDPTNQTERDQIDVLIGMKKDEIKNLEGLKDQFTDDYVPEIRTPAEVAADPDVDSAERAAAANAVLGQDPVTVNTEQSVPTPSPQPDSHPLGGSDVAVAPDGELVKDDDKVKETIEDTLEGPTDDSIGDDDKSDNTEDTKEKKPATKKASAKKS